MTMNSCIAHPYPWSSGGANIERRALLPLIAQLKMGKPRDANVWARFESAPGRQFDLEIKELAAQADPGSK